MAAQRNFYDSYCFYLILHHFWRYLLRFWVDFHFYYNNLVYGENCSVWKFKYFLLYTKFLKMLVSRHLKNTAYQDRAPTQVHNKRCVRNRWANPQSLYFSENPMQFYNFSFITYFEEIVWMTTAAVCCYYSNSSRNPITREIRSLDEIRWFEISEFPREIRSLAKIRSLVFEISVFPREIRSLLLAAGGKFRDLVWDLLDKIWKMLFLLGQIKNPPVAGNNYDYRNLSCLFSSKSKASVWVILIFFKRVILVILIVN